MMGSSERPAAMRRARERQMTIRAAAARAVAAQRRVRRAVDARDQVIQQWDERIARAKEISDAAAAELAVVCGSADLVWHLAELPPQDRTAWRTSVVLAASSLLAEPHAGRARGSLLPRRLGKVTVLVGSRFEIRAQALLRPLRRYSDGAAGAAQVTRLPVGA
jgi:hypothetical protein